MCPNAEVHLQSLVGAAASVLSEPWAEGPWQFSGGPDSAVLSSVSEPALGAGLLLLALVLPYLPVSLSGLNSLSYLVLKCLFCCIKNSVKKLSPAGETWSVCKT